MTMLFGAIRGSLVVALTWNVRRHLKTYGTSWLGFTLLPRSGKGPTIENDNNTQPSVEHDPIQNRCMAEPITDRHVLNKERDLMTRRMELFVLKVQHEVFTALVDLEKRAMDGDLVGNALVAHFCDDCSQFGDDIDQIVTVDRWVRDQGGGGITCIMQNGRVFEKAGVNISVIHGTLPRQAIEEMRSSKQHLFANMEIPNEMKFFAAGVSSVIHPRNPHVPTLHFNFRYFELEPPAVNELNRGPESSAKLWWFGGGVDMTPYTFVEDDCKHFHGEMKKACDKHDPSFYPSFKKWCDNYFHIVHRNERRGIGGLFFDDMDYPNQNEAFSFVESCAKHVLPSYLPLVERNMAKIFSQQDRDWQLIRRGRYAEFNLVYDRGTKFGLLTPGARYESILMSLPMYAKWMYRHEPEPGSNYAKLLEVLKNPREWI